MQIRLKRRASTCKTWNQGFENPPEIMGKLHSSSEDHLRLKGWVSFWVHRDLDIGSVLRKVPLRWRNGDTGPLVGPGPPQEDGRPPHFPRSMWAATKELLRVNKYRIEKIRKGLAFEECEYLENAGE